jgi:Fuseless
LDGPARLPPPLGVTILTSYRSIANPAPPKKPGHNNEIVGSNHFDRTDATWIVALDFLASFFIVPIGVVNFWRGLWLVIDYYWWGFTDNAQDLHYSMLYSAILGISCFMVASEDVVQHFPSPPPPSGTSTTTDDDDSSSTGKARKHTWFANQVFGRLITFVLAVGAVNFWRVVWYLWEEFGGQSSAWSAAVSHIVGVVGLLALGCLSCICAPPSTIGVDAVAHENCADEPLFFSIPVAAEALYGFAIFRQPSLAMDQDAVERYQRAQATPAAPPRPSLKHQEAFRLASRQTAAQLDGMDRMTMTTLRPITERNATKRMKNQFFRNR